MRALAFILALTVGLVSGVAFAQPRWGVAYHRGCRRFDPTLALAGDGFHWCGHAFTLDGRHLGALPERDGAALDAPAPEAPPPDARAQRVRAIARRLGLRRLRDLWLGRDDTALVWTGDATLTRISTSDGRRLTTYRAPAAIADVQTSLTLDRVAYRSGGDVVVLALERERYRRALRVPSSARAYATSLLSDDGRTLLVYRSEAMLTVYREGAGDLTLPPAPAITPPAGWVSIEYAYPWWTHVTLEDGYPHGAVPGDGHGLIAAWRAPRGYSTAEVYATDAHEFAATGDDRRAWSRAVLARYGGREVGASVHDLRVGRDRGRERAMSWWTPATGNRLAAGDYRTHVRIFERGAWLYRVEVHLPDRPCPRSCGGDCIETTLCAEDAQRTALRAFHGGGAPRRAR